MNTEDIIKNRAAISLTDTGSLKTTFCKDWGAIKSGLEVLQGLIKNPIAKGAIELVIAAGDAVSKQICN